jgi:MFS family permease
MSSVAFPITLQILLSSISVQSKLVDQSSSIRGESDRPSFSITKIIVYFGILNLVLGLASPASILGIPISYLLKDHFHLRPVQTATFWAVTSSPFCVAFLFGFLRDRFRSSLGGDRGWLALGSAATVACYLCLALMDLDLRTLTVLVLIVFVCFVFMSAAAGAMLTAVAQARLMSGRLSTTSQSGTFVPGVLAALAGGWIVSHLSARGTFVAAAAITGVVLIR